MRSSGITLDDDEDPDDPDYCVTAMRAAAHCENVQILKRLKPNPQRDDVDGLLSYAATFGNADVVRYLLDLRTKPNDKPNGGSTALENSLESFRYGSFRARISTFYDRRSKASKYYVSNTRDTIQLLLEHRALWRPDTDHELVAVRRTLFECEPEVTLELIERLVKHAACSPETINKLLRTPAMRKHLTPVVEKLRWLSFDLRTVEQKAEEARREEAYRNWRLRELASRYNREKLYGEIWAEPIQHVAKRYNISDVGLAKICRKLNIPRPDRGYWAMKASGKSPRRPQLPELLC